MENTEDLRIKAALDQYMDCWLEKLSNAPKHRFSLGYRLRKRKILRMESRLRRTMTKTPLRKAVYYAVLTVLLAALFSGVAYAVYAVFESFTTEKHDIYTNVWAVDDENAPTEILRKLEITYDLSGYDVEIMSDIFMDYWVIYSKGDKQIQFMQTPKCYYKNVRYNTELSPTGLVREEINGNEAIYFETRDASYCYTVDMFDYIVYVSTNIDKETALEVVKSIK